MIHCFFSRLLVSWGDVPSPSRSASVRSSVPGFFGDEKLSFSLKKLIESAELMEFAVPSASLEDLQVESMKIQVALLLRWR